MLFQLDENDIWFPDPSLADSDGLLAIGGDLSLARLELAYNHGIFPWYDDQTPILWYAPHERFILFPNELTVSKSMRKIIRSSIFTVTYNRAFKDVITNCAKVKRSGQDGTWITKEMQEAYVNLNKEGIAISVDVWQNAQLCGGLYGVICGKKQHVFCGESMFSLLPNASKLALIYLCNLNKFELIDCQIESEYLKSMGARMISRERYQKILNAVH
jgi:leucyl/phenylalanyl-tRNA--protein transferase